MVRHPDFTYTIPTFVNRIMAQKKSATQNDLLGLGADQIVPPDCPYSIAETHWV
jgi:hypothetical protein